MARPRQFDEDEVVDKATEVFWTQGYRATTPRQLMEATGLSKSSLYNVFGSKEGLFVRAFRRYIERQHTEVAARLAREPLRAALVAMYENIILTSAPTEHGGAGMGCLFVATSVESQQDCQAMQAPMQEARADLMQIFADRIAQAQAQGEVDARRDPEALARFLVSTNMGLVVFAKFGASIDELRDIAHTAIEAVLS